MLDIINNFISKINLKKKYNVLIVDDVVDNVELLDNYLDKSYIKVYKHYNPLESVKDLSTIDFSLLVLDIQMPNLNGYDLALNIKTGKYGDLNKDKPIIFITGIYGDNESKMKGYNIGSIDYILKPVDYENFETKVDFYLDNINDKNILLEERMKNIKKSIIDENGL